MSFTVCCQICNQAHHSYITLNFGPTDEFEEDLVGEINKEEEPLGSFYFILKSFAKIKVKLRPGVSLKLAANFSKPA